jgi:hypothetical protein
MWSGVEWEGYMLEIIKTYVGYPHLRRLTSLKIQWCLFYTVTGLLLSFYKFEILDRTLSADIPWSQIPLAIQVFRSHISICSQHSLEFAAAFVIQRDVAVYWVGCEVFKMWTSINGWCRVAQIPVARFARATKFCAVPPNISERGTCFVSPVRRR